MPRYAWESSSAPSMRALALAREQREQRDERQDQQHGVGLRCGAERREQADRRQQRVDAIDEREVVPHARAGARRARAARARIVITRVAGELRHERERRTTARAPMRGVCAPASTSTSAGGTLNHASASAVMARWGDVRGAHGLRRVGEHDRRGDEQRHHRRRQEQEHRDEHDLGRHDGAGAGVELHARDDGVGEHQQRGEHQVERAVGGREDGERDRRDEEARAEARRWSSARAARCPSAGAHGTR